MAEAYLKPESENSENNVETSPQLRPQPRSLDKINDDLIRLARETQERQHAASETQQDLPISFPDFGAQLRKSGRWLLIGDIMALLSAFVIGGLLSRLVRSSLFNDTFAEVWNFGTLSQFLAYIGLGMVSLLWLDTKGHYRQRLPYWEAIGHFVTIAMLGLLACGFIAFAAKGDASRLWMSLNWIMFGIFLFAGRSVVRKMLSNRQQWVIPSLIIGSGPSAQSLERAIRREKAMGYKICGNIPASMLRDLNRPQAWKNLLRQRNANHVFLALEGNEIERHPHELKAMTSARVPCSIVPPWLGLPSTTLSPHHFLMQDVLILHDTNRLKLPMARVMKRALDIILSASALMALAPVLVIVALIVRRDGGPAFFIQQRVGRNGKLFPCFKFRSMRSDAEEFLQKYLAENPAAAEEWKKFQKLKDDVRITKFGNFIRKTSIDELPQLFNVLIGDMSLVGPRPIMPEQNEMYAEDIDFYQSVRPGITGPWQVSGRNTLTFKERIELESWYARNWSVWLDIVILMKTVPTLLFKRDQTS